MVVIHRILSSSKSYVSLQEDLLIHNWYVTIELQTCTSVTYVNCCQL